MNKTTIKISVLAFLGFMTYGYAQQQQQDPYKGKVGVNTITPSATMDIRPSTVNAQKEATTNEGIIAPKLSKTRIANIETPVEGTLVYATDATYTAGSDATVNNRVAKITEKGYYFYNGTEWVKAGSDSTEVEWTYQGQVIEQSGAISDVVNLRRGIFSSNPTVTVKYRTTTGKNREGAFVVNKYSTQGELTAETHILGDGGIVLNRKPMVGAPNILGYVDFQQEISKTLVRTGLYDFLKNSSTNDDYLGYGYVIGSEASLSALTDRDNSSIYMRISQGDALRKNKLFLEQIDKGGYTLGDLGFTKANTIGNYSFYTLLSGSGIDTGTGINTVKLTYSHNRFLDGASWNGATTRLQKKVDTTLMGFIDFGIHGIENNTNINNGLGFGFNETLHAVIRENGNVGVGTTTPTEKLDVAGNIKSSSLASNAGNRHVYADANGVLKIGTTDVTTLASLWTEDVTNNSIKLAVNSDGSTRSNAVSILDDGKVHASSFMGTNGATIFPDYVFQKYYTGTSSIKADYNFKSLSQVEDFVKTNGHLPGYKSAETIKAQGYVDLMETQLTNVEKIEELYLHSIEQDKVNKQQAEALKAKDAEIADLKQRLERLEKLIQ